MQDDDTAISFPRVTSWPVREGRRVVSAPVHEPTAREIAARRARTIAERGRAAAVTATRHMAPVAAKATDAGLRVSDAALDVFDLARGRVTPAQALTAMGLGGIAMTLAAAAMAIAPGGSRASAAGTAASTNIMAAGDAVRTLPASGPVEDHSVAGMARQIASSVRASVAPVRMYGAIGADVRLSLSGAGLTQSQIDDYLRIIAPQINSPILQGDAFDVVVDRTWRDGAVVYAGLYRRGDERNDIHMSQWTVDGRLQWFDARRASYVHAGAQRPVPGEVSSNFGPRLHPILGYTRMHKGMDFRAGYGTPILAVQTGYVTKAGWGSGYGNEVELTHGAGLTTTYAHMSRIVAEEGELVRQGQVIGYVGATGLATGPHLHLELRRNGVPINPDIVTFTAKPQLAGDDLKGYQRRLKAILALPVAGQATRIASR